MSEPSRADINCALFELGQILAFAFGLQAGLHGSMSPEHNEWRLSELIAAARRAAVALLAHEGRAHEGRQEEDEG